MYIKKGRNEGRKKKNWFVKVTTKSEIDKL